VSLGLAGEMRADLEVIKFFSKSGDGTFTLLYSDFTSNTMAGGAHNNICAWDVCRGNRQGLKFSNGEDLWAPGEGSRIGSFQVMTPVHKVKFSRACARSFDYDPESPSWFISEAFGASNGRTTDTDIGYIEIAGLHDFCAVDADKFGGGIKVGRTPSPVRTNKLPRDDLVAELQRIRHTLKTTPEDEVLRDLAVIKRRASMSEKLSQEILPIMMQIHRAMTSGSVNDASATNEPTARVGRRGTSAGKQAKKVMAVVLAIIVIIVACIVLSRGSDEGKTRGAPKAKTVETKKDK